MKIKSVRLFAITATLSASSMFLTPVAHATGVFSTPVAHGAKKIAARVALGVAVAGTVLTGVSVISGGKTIQPGERGVEVSLSHGTNTTVSLPEGYHAAFWPFQRIVAYDVRAKEKAEKTMPVQHLGSVEGAWDVSARVSIKPAQVGKLHQTVGEDFYAQVVQPVLRAAVRDVGSQYTLADAFGKREEIARKIESQVRTTLSGKYSFVDLEQVMVRDIQPPKPVKDAIELKLAKKEEADAAEYGKQKAIKDAETALIAATGTAAAQKKLAEGLTPNILQYEGIQAFKELAKSPNAKVIVMGGSKDGTPIILGNDK